MAGRLTAILVTAAGADVETTLGIAGRALQGGATAILVRRPDASAREVFELARRLRPATRQLDCALLVSDRLDVAIAADADGVHLGARSLPPAAARRVLPPGMLLGRSVHDLDEAEGMDGQVDYLVLGPVFATASHPDRAPLGLDHVVEARQRVSVPLVGIGGVTAANVAGLVRAGCVGAAAISAFYAAEDAADTARAFRAAFGTR